MSTSPLRASSTLGELEITLGETLRQLRLHRNIDQASLAERAGISTRALRNLESGRGSQVSTLLSVLRALGRESWLDSLAPVASINPLMVRQTSGERQRASSPRNRN
jgi:transcriptional regulator with XRE-family HTH domain